MTITLVAKNCKRVEEIDVRGNFTTALPLEKIFSEDEIGTNSDAALEITSSYRFRGAVTYLSGGFIKLKRVRLNTVSFIEIRVIKAGNSNKRKKLGSSDGAREDGDGSDGKYYMHQSE